MENIEEVSMTRTEFEEEFCLTPPGEVTNVVLQFPDRIMRIRLVGQKHFEIQQLEKLYKLKGDQ